MFRVSVTAVAVAAMLASSVAQAITVESIQGRVAINRGVGFQPLTATTAGKSGDRVMASPNSSAEIVYDNGCREKVEPGQVVMIKAEPPCAGIVPPNYLITGALITGAVVTGVILLNKPASP